MDFAHHSDIIRINLVKIERILLFYTQKARLQQGVDWGQAI